MNKWSKNLLFVGSLPIFISPIVIIASCSSSNNTPDQTKKIELKSTQIKLDGLSDKNANNYAQENNLKQLIFDNKEKFFNNIPTDFSVNNIFVSEIVANTPSPGTLEAQIEIKSGDTVLIPKTKITLTGFQENVLGLNGTEIQLKDQTSVDPKEYKEEGKLKAFVFSQKEQIFKNLPTNLTENQINIEQDSIKIRSGALILTLSVKAANISDPDLIMPTKIKLTGFMATFAFKDEIVKLSDLSQEAAKDITEERLKEIIVSKASEIFDTLPEGGISKEQVLIQQKQRAFVVNGQKLTARVAIKEKNSETLLIDYETIVLTGFKITIGLNNQVDLTSKLESGEENLDQYLENNYSKLKTLIYKNRNSFFNDWPEDEFDQNSFTIIEAKIDKKQKGKLIVKIKVIDPNNNDSDLVSETEVIVNGFFDLKSEEIKLNFNLGEEYYGKYLNPASIATEQQKQLMTKLIFDHQSEIFVNNVKDLQLNYIKVKNINANSFKDLRITFLISRTENESDLLKEQEVTLADFFVLNSSTITLQLEANEKPKNQYKNQTNGGNEKMQGLIYKYKNRIFTNLPNGFDQTWIQITNPATDVAGKPTQLNIGFKIVKDNQEILPEVDIIFDGFTA